MLTSHRIHFSRSATTLLLATLAILLVSCEAPSAQVDTAVTPEASAPTTDAPEYFSLRPELEKAFGYTHAVRVGNHIRVSGAVSMDDNGTPTGMGDVGAQLRNCYTDLQRILAHYDCTFADVIVENIYTTDMDAFLQQAAYRADIYGEQYPTGTWLEVSGLAAPEFLIEIEIEAYKAD